VAMDTGVEHGQHPDTGAAGPPDGTGGRAPQGPAARPHPAHGEHASHRGHHVAPPDVAARRVPLDDVPTTILDLRTAFAEAGPQDAAPLGVVTVEREHPARAALAFLAVLALIAGVASGIVVGTARAGQAVYDRLFGPPQCTAAQVADGSSLEAWLLAVMQEAAGPTAKVVRVGCVTEGVLDPLTGQAASATVGAGKTADKLVARLKKRDCTLGTATPSGRRSCTVSVGGRLAVLELRPAGSKKTVTVTVSFR